MLTVPFVTVPEFRAAPTFLDTRNLRSGGSPDEQDAELENALLRASAWCGNFLSSGMSMAAHAVDGERRRGRIDAAGRLWLNPKDYPVISVQSVSYGLSLTELLTISDPAVWIEDGALVSVDVSGVPTTQARPMVIWSYVAGYVATCLASSASAGATAVVLSDPTGVRAGDELRLWDPGVEETVTVANSYVSGSTSVPLAAPLAHAHTVTAGAGGRVGVSALPEDVHLAVIHAATALLMRPDSTAEDNFPDAALTTSTRDADPRHEGAGLILEAKRILRSYRKVR